MGEKTSFSNQRIGGNSISYQLSFLLCLGFLRLLIFIHLVLEVPKTLRVAMRNDEVVEVGKVGSTRMHTHTHSHTHTQSISIHLHPGKLNDIFRIGFYNCFGVIFNCLCQIRVDLITMAMGIQTRKGNTSLEEKERLQTEYKHERRIRRNKQR